VLLAPVLLVNRVAWLYNKIETMVAAGDTPVGTFAVATVVETAIIAVAAMLSVRYWPAVAKRSLPAIALVVFVGSLVFWDRRGEWDRASAAQVADLRPNWSLPADAQVFWQNDPIGPWFVLERASYVSTLQGSGIAFGRDTAIAFRHRVAVVQPLMRTEILGMLGNNVAAHTVSPEFDAETLISVCARDPELDAMVLSREVPGSFAAAWDTPAPIYDEWALLRGVARPAVRRVYLYLCDDLLRTASHREPEGSARRGP
jgi:hypothetical protein